MNNNTDFAARNLGPSEYKVKKRNSRDSQLNIIDCIDPTDGEERYLVTYQDNENNTQRESGKIGLTSGKGDKTIILEDCSGKESVKSVSISGAS